MPRKTDRSRIMGVKKRFVAGFPRTAKALRLIRRKVNRLASRFLPWKFANKPRNLRISRSVHIRGAERISMGDDVYIGPHSILKASKSTGSLMKHPDNLHVEQVFDSGITIGNRVSATGSLHLAVHSHITIEDDVMLASNVFMADAVHGYDHTRFPYKYQGMTQIAPIRVGRGCWIGQNVVIMPGVTIGEMTIIGANSVVTRDIPAKCVAVGSPAKVIKRWNDENQEWAPVDEDESEPSATVAAVRRERGRRKSRPDMRRMWT